MSNDEQAVLWNDTVGPSWVENAEFFDATLEPFGSAVLNRLALHPGERVVDIGCGTGAATLAVAAAATPGRVTGLDLSEPMLALARRRAKEANTENVSFEQVDVQGQSFGDAEFDVAFSRFGVMFFSDPETAFENIARSLVAGGRLGFVCFREPALNPFIVVPILAAGAFLDMAPPPGPTEPSPFSLADPERVRAILGVAGFADVEIDPGPAKADLGVGDDLVDLAERVLRQNPAVAPALRAASDEARRSAIAAAASALGEHVTDGRVVLGAATWVVTAMTRAP